MSSEHIDHALSALSDPTRRRIVELLAAGGAMRVGDLAARFDSSRQAVTRHLDILCRAELVATERRGRERISRIAPDAFAPLRDWLAHYDRFWAGKLEDLKDLVEGREKT